MVNHQTSRHFWPQDTSWLLCLKYLSPFFFVSVDEMSSADTYTLTCMKVNLLFLTLTCVFFSPSLSAPSRHLSSGPMGHLRLGSMVIVPLAFSHRLISQSMGIIRGAPPTFAACPPPPPSCPYRLFFAPTHSIIQPAVLPSIHKMTLEFTEWSSIWIFTACNRQ